MAIEQPEIPSVSQPAVDGAEAPAQRSEAAEEKPSDRSWWQKLWPRNRGEAEPAEQDEPAESPTSQTLTLTREELQRQVQSEVDRREAERFRRAQIEQRKKLRDEDPWEFAKQERDAEELQQANGQVTNVLGTIGATHDRVTIDPLVDALDEGERQRILGLEGAGLGLDGRKLIVSESLKALEKKWKADAEREAEQKLRRNPAFRKQVLSEMRGMGAEPEFIGSTEASATDRKVSDILRSRIGVHRSA